MNCANHPQNPVSAYCRTCGKPLCTSCTRPVMGVIYCETCLAERVGFTPPPPPASPYPYPPGIIPPPPSAGPNPGFAGVLGIIPGVGAVYNGQYAKGLVHLLIFVCVIVGFNSGLPGELKAALGIFLGFFCAYQIVDAVRTAKAIQAQQTPPDPFGLSSIFSPGPTPQSPQSATSELSRSRSIPTGALVLIILGILFLLHNLDIPFLSADVLWALVVMGIGLWLLAKRMEVSGGITKSSARGLVGPAVVITLGGQWLLDSLRLASFDRTWPLLLIVPGVMLAMERSSQRSPGSQFPPPPPPPPPPAPVGPETPVTNVEPPSEVKNG